MAFRPGPNAALGVPAAEQVDTSPKVPVGTVAEFIDDVLGVADFIYLPGVAGVVAGDLVYPNLNPAARSVVRATATAGANSGRPVAVAVSAVVANTFGWFQISGSAVVNVTAGAAANSPLYASATAGSGTTTAAAGAQIAGARAETAIGTPAAGKAYVTLNRPTMQTQIT